MVHTEPLDNQIHHFSVLFKALVRHVLVAGQFVTGKPFFSFYFFSPPKKSLFFFYILILVLILLIFNF